MAKRKPQAIFDTARIVIVSTVEGTSDEFEYWRKLCTRCHCEHADLDAKFATK